MYAKNVPTFTSRCLGVTIRGTRSQLVGKYEQMAFETTDAIEAELYRQQAEHWRRHHIK